MPGLEIGHDGVGALVGEFRRGGHEHRHLVDARIVHDRDADALGHRDLVVGLDVDHGIHGLGGHGGHHVVHVHAHFLEVALLEPGRRHDHIHKDVADRGAGLVRDLAALEVADLAEVEVLARDHLRSLADILDAGDRDQTALVVADDEGLARIGAEVDLPRHHLLHGEVARRHREFLGLDPVLLKEPRLEQVVGRHAPDVGLEPLADRVERECGTGGAERRQGTCANGESVPSCDQCARHGISSVSTWPSPPP